jgi:hypothetical protein
MYTVLTIFCGGCIVAKLKKFDSFTDSDTDSGYKSENFLVRYGKSKQESKQKSFLVSSVAEPEPHHFNGARAVTRCGSSSKAEIHHTVQYISQTVSFFLILFLFTTISIIKILATKIA